jgi:proteasome lid subunit RPN8/RPN11
MPPVVEIAEPVAAALAAAFAASAPREFVGLLGGDRGRDRWLATHFVALPNTAADDDRFVVEPAAFAAAEALLRQRGAAWLGFVHSHPFAAPRPSAADRDQLWRDCVQLIVGGSPRALELRAFWFATAGGEPLPLALGTAAVGR